MSESSIWNKLRAKGFSEKATASIMGNMEAESNCISYRLQSDFTTGYTRSIEYTAQVDSGAISPEQFAYNGPGGGGYGLCQWTFYTRKTGLYNLAKKKGTSIGDEQTGVDWFYEEVQQVEYRDTWNALNADSTIYSMVCAMLRNYEKPADQSDAAAQMRTRFAQDIYNKYAGQPAPEPEPSPEPQPKPTPTPSGDTCEITVRVLRSGDMGRDVFLLQCGLSDMGYSVGVPDGDFGENTESGLNDFKSDCNLDADGVADEAVWQILFQ